MIGRKLIINLNERPMYGDFEITAGSVDPDGLATVVTSVITTTVEKYGVIPSAGVPIDRSTVQGLFNQLWLLGFRPADGTGNAGHVAPLEEHIDDLRRIAFSALEVEDRS